MAKNKIIISSDEEEDEQEQDFDQDDYLIQENQELNEEDEEGEEQNDALDFDDYDSQTEIVDQSPISSDAEDNKAEDSDMSEDLEIRSEEDKDEVDEKDSKVKRKSIKITIKPPIRKNTDQVNNESTTDQLSRSTRKRQVNYYQDEEDSEFDVTSNKKMKEQPKLQPHQINPDLMLTDEENEYNPKANPDVSKMTERQRARYNSEADQFIELDDSGKLAKANKKQKVEETEEEIALRKAENARKRLDYKNKILEEEKRDTLNKLLKRRATKSREIISEDKDNNSANDSKKSANKIRRPTLDHPALIRYVNNTTTLNGNSILAYK